jgi:hypothetical protein
MANGSKVEVRNTASKGACNDYALDDGETHVILRLGDLRPLERLWVEGIADLD